MSLLKKRLVLEIFGFFFSGGIFIWLSAKLSVTLAESGLTQYLSLLFTDLDVIMANAGDYALTLLETTPVFSLAFTLAAILAVVFYSAKLADVYVDYKKLKLSINLWV